MKKVKVNQGKLLLLFTGILSGILLVIFILNNPYQSTKILTYDQYKNMQIKINTLKAENKGLYKKYSELEYKLKKYQEAGEEVEEKINKTIKEELDYIKLFYGLTEVTGSGVTIILDDNRKEEYNTQLEADNSVVHNIDLYETANELRNAGAEAIAINGYRVTAQSRITCEGPIIMIDGNNIVPPFEIDVIGDINALEYTMSSQENKFSQLNLRGLFIESKSFDEKTLPEYKGKNDTIYMKEIKYSK